MSLSQYICFSALGISTKFQTPMPSVAFGTRMAQPLIGRSLCFVEIPGMAARYVQCSTVHYHGTGLNPTACELCRDVKSADPNIFAAPKSKPRNRSKLMSSLQEAGLDTGTRMLSVDDQVCTPYCTPGNQQYFVTFFKVIDPLEVKKFFLIR